MIQVTYKIGDKDDIVGLRPISFQVSFVNSDDLKYIPYFSFHKKYQLPHKIVHYKRIPFIKEKKYKQCSRSHQTLELNFNFFVAGFNASKISKSCRSKTKNLNNLCKRCFGCTAYLPHDLSESAYFDFMLLFREISRDLHMAWDNAVEEAKKSVEFEKKRVVITPENYKSTILTEKLQK